MLLYIGIGAYIIETAYVWIDAINHQLYLDRRLKKEGYKFTNEKKFGPSDGVWGTICAILLSIPVLNLLSPLSHIDKDRSYDEYKNYLDEAGAIEKDDDFVDTTNLEEKHIIEINDTKLINRINKSGHIYYSPMYRGEEDTLIEEKGKVYKKTL